MESVVHNFGSCLEECVKNGSFKKAGKLINHVRNFLGDNVEDNTLNFVISKIFDDSYNLLKFLINIKDKANQKGWKEVLSEGLDLLNHFINNFYNKLRPFNLEMIKTCRAISISNAQANEKNKSINILCNILKHDSEVPMDEITDIYESYFKFCGVHQKTTAAKVQKSIFVLLGTISNKYPYIITNHNNLIDTYVIQLRRQSESYDRDTTLVSGCIDGLSNILEAFPVTNGDLIKRIYNIISKLLLSGSIRFDIRDVVIFISKHCSMIIEDVYNDAPELWFETIKKWALLKGDNRKAGYVALECFYRELANLLKTKSDEKGKKCFQSVEEIRFFKIILHCHLTDGLYYQSEHLTSCCFWFCQLRYSEFFFDYFIRIMKDETADIIEVRLAIRGFGSFSIACKVHMTDQNLLHMFMIIVNRIEQDYFVQENPSTEQLEYLPDYIHCFSTILHHTGEYSFDQIDSLQQISVLMIKTFPNLSVLYHFSVFDSLILSMCYLYQLNPKYLENYLQRVVYQGVMWTCSHRTCFDVDIQTNEDDKNITYKNYLPLWRNLLNFVESPNSKYKTIHVDVKVSVVKMIYDELIKTLLMLINKLNLNTKSIDDVPVVDPQTTSDAEKIDDFIIFINAVDFYIDLFSKIDNENFKKWFEMYTNHIMIKSSKYTFVSGFYKLLKLGLQISDKLDYFDEAQLKKKENRRISHQKILLYLEKVLLSVHEFKDDLQVSCLQLLLTIPLSFVPSLLPTITPVFEMSLTVGRGYLKLAETAVHTLEKWYKSLPIEDLKPLLKNVLPNLDPFLRSKGFVGDPDVPLEAKVSKRSKAKRKVLIEQDSELANLQNKILMFVGQLDSELCLYLIKTDVEIEQVTWEDHPYLKFTVPYSEVKPNIYLDRILPRVLELALSSGDQKTRITACELLHAIVIFMLGTSRQMSRSNKMSKLFEKIMLPIIQLGCDSNDIVRQLFNPLAFQMIHWYSSPMQLMSSETSILIDILMEGISHPNNTAVRDLSGKCIKEFVIWTIKQCQKEDLEKNSQNINAIVSKLCSFCLHPNSFKRLGAALAFNHLYSHLREEQAMIDIYWVELMYSLMISMSLDESKSKNNSQLDAALSHIERVLREKNQVFNKHSMHRKIPPGIEGPLLKDSVMWILKQTGSNNTIYRRKSIQLFCNLSPYVESDCGRVKNFVTRFVNKDNSNWFVRQYDGDLQKLPNFKSWDKLGTVEIVLLWFQYLLKCLDGYKYLLDYDIIDFKSLHLDSLLPESIKYFFEFIAPKKLQDTFKLFPLHDIEYVCLPDEIERFTEWKCEIIIGFFDYLLSTLNHNNTNFYTDCFWEFICYCVFQPNILGFSSVENLDKKLVEVFNKFCKKLPSFLLNNLTKSLSNYFEKNYFNTTTLNTSNISLIHRNILKGWLLIQNCDLKYNLKDNSSKYFENSVELVFNSLIKDTEDKKCGIKLSSTVEAYANLHLQLCFKLNNPVNILCDSVTNATQIKHPEMYCNITYGEYFLNYFKDTIIEYILIHHKDCIKKLCSNWQNFDENTPMIILMNILKYISENPHLKQTVNMKDFFENVVYGCCKVFQTGNSLDLKQRNFQIELLSHIIRLENKQTDLGNKFKFIKQWFLAQLAYYPYNQVSKTILQFHTNVLCFLHCVTGPEDHEDTELESCLDSFLNNILEATSDQLDNSDLLVLFKKLLDYLVMSKSRIVLKTTMDTFTALKYEEENVNVQNALSKYISAISPGEQYESMKKVYEHCNNLNHTNKYKIVKIFLLNLLRFCSNSAFEEFYVQNIKTIIKGLKSTLTQDSDANTIVNKSINLILLDVLFSRINISNFNDKSCLITKSMYGETLGKGNELLQESLKIVTQIPKQNLIFEDDRKELYRLYHCDAFNCLVSVVCNSKNPKFDAKTFQYLFFIVKEDKNIWKNIIDCSVQITVPQNMDKLPSRKKIFINIRNELQKNEEKPVYYIESQSLFNSTLSEDICKFDFTNTLVRTANFQQDPNNTTTENKIGTMFLQAVDFNNHECMATMTALINHMVENNISPLPNDVKTASLPGWMEDIKKLLTNSDNEVNIRSFIARVIHNSQYFFKYYAKYFFEAVVKFIVDGCTGININYFVADLVLMLISWLNNLELSEIKQPASQLIKFLIENSCNDRQDMMKYNLEIIKTSIQIWRTIIEVPHETLYHKLNHNSFQEKLVGIHLSGIILANDLIPWSQANVDSYTSSIVRILHKEKQKKITKPTAELIGMILNYMKGKKDMEQHFKKLNTELDGVLRSAETDKVFHSLEQIQLHYQDIIDRYIRKICVYVFSETDPILKCICLKNILRRIDNNDTIRLTYKDVTDLLNIDHMDVRLLTLQIINKIFSDFKKQHQIVVLSAVCEHKADMNSIIRYAVYEVLMSVYNTYISQTDSESLELIRLCKPALLSALIDSDVEIQEKIENFWYSLYQSLKLSEKYEKFLTELYSPDIETFYLGCVNYFLLHSCKDTPEYKKLMFEHPLSDCKFDDYQFMYNWRLHNTSMAPMFSNTLRGSDLSAPQLVGIRATNSLRSFEPTKSSAIISSSLDTSSSFLFDINATSSQTKNKFEHETMKKDTNVYGRIFLKDRNRDLGFAKVATERNIRTEQQRKERVKRKEANVVIYRQYRKGDLPDIQIPYSAIIDPLKILARRDGVLSRQLYVMLFSGLINELENSDQFIENFNDGIMSVFSQTYMYVPNMIGAFLDASFENNKKKNVKKIHVASNTLSNVCKNSGLLPIGCLLMEEYISMDEELPSGSKRGCGNSDNEVNQWVKLADMYKELNEWDAVIGIFSSNQMDCSPEISEAITAEANSNWKHALKKYESLLNTDTNSNRKDFYYDSYFKCFANLSDWESMSKTVRELSDSTFWDDDWNQEKLLPWYMTAEMCLMLEGNSNNTIVNHLNEWMKDKDKAEYLKDKFSEELAVLSLLQNDANSSKHYTKYCFGKFLEDWSHIDPLFSKIRSRKLLNFQKVIDLNKYLLNANNNNLINYWQRNSSLTSYSLPSTEIRTLYRQQFITSLENSFATAESQNSEEYVLELKDIKLSCSMNLVESAIQNNNYVVARKYCRCSKRHISTDNDLGNFKLGLAMSKVGYILAEKQSEEAKINYLYDSWARLDMVCKKYANTYIDLQIESSGQIYKISQSMYNIFKNNTNSYSQLKNKVQSLISSSSDFLPDLQNYGVNNLRKAIEMGENILKESENIKVLNNLTETYLSLVTFAQNQKDSEIYHKDIVKYVLRAMNLGSRDARQIFPCLLQFPELDGNLLEIFKSESESVPTWMFLLWIPQLLISLDTSTKAVEDLVERIALTYPQSLIYMYRLAREKYNLSFANDHFKYIIKKLDDLLENPLIDKFLNEMSFLCIPELYFNYHLDKIVKNYSTCSTIKEAMSTLSSDLKSRIQTHPNFKSVETTLQSLENEIKDVSNIQELKRKIQKIYDKNKNNFSINKKLKQFSAWLANFKSSDWNCELEIPGQYSGENKPLVKYHAKISSFNQKISCKSNSLRKPIQITIFGNDSKEYSFLVKFGEDLRQDQRIQQLFSLANNILKSDSECRERNLCLEQYQVIPLTKSLGLIKVVENTKSLSEFMLHSAKDDEIMKKSKEVQNEYYKWIRSAAGGAALTDIECYAKACLKYDKDTVTRMFTRFVNAVPADILSKSFWSISMSPSTYTYLRHQFITSYAVMCVVHWLLGIGDRNLGNCLISLHTGRAIGIDFGYAFGVMTQHSPIPELIPFRLTPHILSLLEPLKQTGFVDRTMVHCLKALRRKKHLLITTLDVFIKDPSVDWLEFTKTQTSDEDSEDMRWHPDQKMDLVCRKLDGANSAAISIKEIKNGRIGNLTVRDAYVSLLKGYESNVRSQYNVVGLSAEDQVKCLLDQATDYNILGRQYAGLELWI